MLRGLEGGNALKKKNRNDEIETEIAFDYDDFDEEEALKRGLVEQDNSCDENPYEDYDIYDVVITETVTKKIAVFAKDAKSAQEWVEEALLDDIDMVHGIEEYKRTAEGMDDEGSTSSDYTVPLWWYEVKEEE